jgi:hypothetical protein
MYIILITTFEFLIDDIGSKCIYRFKKYQKNHFPNWIRESENIACNPFGRTFSPSGAFTDDSCEPISLTLTTPSIKLPDTRST